MMMMSSTWKRLTSNKLPLLWSRQKYIKQCNFAGSNTFLLLLLLRCTGCDIIWLGGNKCDQIWSSLDVDRCVNVSVKRYLSSFQLQKTHSNARWKGSLWLADTSRKQAVAVHFLSSRHVPHIVIPCFFPSRISRTFTNSHTKFTHLTFWWRDWCPRWIWIRLFFLYLYLWSWLFSFYGKGCKTHLSTDFTNRVQVVTLPPFYVLFGHD